MKRELYLILFKDGSFQTSVQKPDKMDYGDKTRLYKVTKDITLEKISEWYEMCLNELDKPLGLENLKEII